MRDVRAALLVSCAALLSLSAQAQGLNGDVGAHTGVTGAAPARSAFDPSGWSESTPDAVTSAGEARGTRSAATRIDDLSSLIRLHSGAARQDTTRAPQRFPRIEWPAPFVSGNPYFAATDAERERARRAGSSVTSPDAAGATNGAASDDAGVDAPLPLSTQARPERERPRRLNPVRAVARARPRRKPAASEPAPPAATPPIEVAGRPDAAEPAATAEANAAPAISPARPEAALRPLQPLPRRNPARLALSPGSSPAAPPRIPDLDAALALVAAGGTALSSDGRVRVVGPSASAATRFDETGVQAIASVEADADAAADEVDRYAFDGPSPADLARTLVRLQDDVARGSVSALSAQRLVLTRMARDVPQHPPRVWADPAQARGLLIYALSGGDPSVVRAAFSSERVAPDYEPLVRGALAFLEGRPGDARRALDPIALADVEHSVRGPLALAKAALIVDEDPAAADAFLQKARYAGPGTLVEEAALRRTALIAAERNDVEAFEDATSRYFRKFRASVYAGNFRNRLAGALTRMSFVRDPEGFDIVDEILAPLTPAGKRELYLLIARAAVEFGNEGSARLASERAVALAEPGTLDHSRGNLYLAAANVVDPEGVGSARETLEGLTSDPNLEAPDRALLGAALELAEAVDTLPDTFAPESALADAFGDPAESADDGFVAGAQPGGTEPGDDPFRIDTAMEERVSTTLAAVDALLETKP